MSKPLHVEPLERRAYLTIAFAAPVHFAVPPLENGVLNAPAVGDFDGDGKADLIVGNATDADTGTTNLIFAKGDGLGTFAPASAPVTPGVFTSQPKAGDFNNDDKLDVIVTDEFHDLVRVLLGNGDGTFQAPVNINVGVAPGSVVVADLNGDGADDVAVNNRGPVADRGNDTVSILLGGGSGLGAPATLNAGDDPASILLADVNADAKLDLIVGNSGGSGSNPVGSIQAFLGAGNGTFAATPITTAGPRGMSAAGEFNGDGKVDLVSSVSETGVVTLLLGNGDGSFVNQAPPPGEDLLVAVAGDFDADGKLDVAATGLVNETLSVLPGNGNGTFAAPIAVGIQGAGPIVVGELTGDAKPEIVTASFAEGPRITTLVNASTAGGNPTTGPDLTAAVTGKAPAAVISGTSKGKFTVTVTNAGTVALDKTAVAVRLVASTDATVGAGDVELGTVTKSLKLKAGKSAKVNVAFTYPTVSASGAYNVIAVVDSGAAVAEANEENNTAAFATPVTIAPAFVDLNGVFGAALPATLTAGKAATFTITIANAGNVAAKGALPTAFTASLDNAASTGDLVLGTAGPKVNIAAGKSKKVKFKVALPDAIAAGQYFVLAALNQGNVLPESNPDNNAVASTDTTTVA